MMKNTVIKAGLWAMFAVAMMFAVMWAVCQIVVRFY